METRSATTFHGDGSRKTRRIPTRRSTLQG
jgi:hypothetical protein